MCASSTKKTSLKLCCTCFSRLNLYTSNSLRFFLCVVYTHPCLSFSILLVCYTGQWHNSKMNNLAVHPDPWFCTLISRAHCIQAYFIYVMTIVVLFRCSHIFPSEQNTGSLLASCRTGLPTHNYNHSGNMVHCIFSSVWFALPTSSRTDGWFSFCINYPGISTAIVNLACAWRADAPP